MWVFTVYRLCCLFYYLKIHFNVTVLLLLAESVSVVDWNLNLKIEHDMRYTTDKIQDYELVAKHEDLSL